MNALKHLSLIVVKFRFFFSFYCSYGCILTNMPFLFTVVPTLTRPQHPPEVPPPPPKCVKRLQSIPKVFKVKHKSSLLHCPQLAKFAVPGWSPTFQSPQTPT